jgi:hypothetical protein
MRRLCHHITHTKHTRILPWFRPRERVSRKTLRPTCLSLLDEDVVGVCTWLPEADGLISRPPDFAILSLSLL